MPTPATPPPKADILVIDDTPDNLHLLSTILTERGYKVRSVTKGVTGLRGAQAAPPDLILLDINMPQMNGYEVCQQLKAEPITQDIPVIFISALDDVLDKVKAFSVGGVDYITKPFQVEEVLARIETHLTLQQLRQQLQAQNVELQAQIRQRQAAEDTFTKVFQASPSPIVITTLADGQLVEANPSFVHMSGYQPADLLGHTVLELNLGIRPELYEQARNRLSETGRLTNHELDFRTRTGEIRTVLISSETIILNGVPCVLTIINDITERKHLENEFISLVSHELRTPMNSIIGALDILSTGRMGHLTEQGQKVLDIATTNTERLIRLVNDILDLERMKSGKITLRPQVCALEELMLQATEAMHGMAEQAGVTLMTRPITVELWADPDRVLQALTNLLSNAIKFSQAGQTVELTATRLSNSDQVNPIQPHPAVLIQVCDQGRGIPADKLQAIFERFQQVDTLDSRQKGGTGLGLAICRNIVEQHQGRIWAESSLGQGSTFKLVLPLGHHTPYA